MVDRTTAAFLAVVAVLVGAIVLLEAGALAPPTYDGPYERTTVTVTDENDTHLATVHVRVANNGSLRYTGLSNTESLAPDEGMLFVHAEEGVHGYVMRRMDFELDMVFIAANGTITTIHHASLRGTPGNDEPYSGRAKYILEVDRGWANRTGVAVGDHVVVPDGVTVQTPTPSASG